MWIGLIMFNVITGLLVDGFSRLREEAQARNDSFENSCFTCGVSLA